MNIPAPILNLISRGSLAFGAITGPGPWLCRSQTGSIEDPDWCELTYQGRTYGWRTTNSVRDRIRDIWRLKRGRGNSENCCEHLPGWPRSTGSAGVQTRIPIGFDRRRIQNSLQ
jgi:hypothetical protein